MLHVFTVCILSTYSLYVYSTRCTMYTMYILTVYGMYTVCIWYVCILYVHVCCIVCCAVDSRIQTGTHCSVEDARHTMMLYLLVQESYEAAMSCDDAAARALELINNDEDDCFNQTTSYLNDAQHLLT